MPWLVRIEDEQGRPRTPDGDCVVEFRLLEHLPPDAIMLKGVDEYANTTFNQQQLKLLLPEWERLGARITSAEDRAAWEKVLAYAKQCLDTPHLYLKFLGD
jgi:hypothetical protein